MRSAERVFANLDGIRFLHPPGWVRRHAPGRAGALRLAGRLHSPSQRGRRNGAEPGLPARAGKHADGRVAGARSATAQAGAAYVDQQKSGRESALMEQALDKTFAALAEANRASAQPAPLSALTVGLQCGGSDGFSGISANPTVGYVSDLVVGAGGKTILSEFPELHGVEQELINRCATDELAHASPT